MNIREIAERTAAVGASITHEQANIIGAAAFIAEQVGQLSLISQNLLELAKVYATVEDSKAEVATRLSEEADVLGAMISSAVVSLNESVEQVDNTMQQIEHFMGSLGQLDSGSM